MSNAASQAAAFYADVARTSRVWTLRDSGGFPCPERQDGKRAMPFWSSEARVRKVIASVPAYAGFEPVEIEWPAFRDRWLKGLVEDELLVGVNWSGSRAVGYDVEPATALAAIEHHLRNSARDGSPPA
jgi:hypothetical protein